MCDVSSHVTTTTSPYVLRLACCILFWKWT